MALRLQLNRTLFLLIIFLFLGIVLKRGEAMALDLKSTAFENGESIPTKYTCKGEDISPALEWDGIPENTKSLVLIVDDPDAPDPKAPKMTWVHWVLYNIPPNAKSITEGGSNLQSLIGAKEGINDWGKIGYGGPCPPIGRHRYFFKLYALSTTLENISVPSKKIVEAAMQGHIIEQAELIGTYAKQE